RQAELTFAMARHAVVDLARVLRRRPRAVAHDRLPRHELRKLRAALAAGGVVLDDSDAAEDKLAELRAMYEPHLLAPADHLVMPLARRGNGRRRQFPLCTKVGHAGGWDREDWRPPAILKSIERSLGRLRTEALDLVQLHSCSEGVLRRGDAIAALETAKQRGLTRYIGYSGDGAAARHAVESGRFDTLQISVSVADQAALEAVLPAARQRQLGVIAKRP